METNQKQEKVKLRKMFHVENFGAFFNLISILEFVAKKLF